LVDIFKVAREVVREWKPKAEKKGIELSVRIPSQGPFLLMDREKIATALRNILMSVISFLGGKEKVLVECSTTENRVLIVIADTGEGLPGDILSRLFMPFTEVAQEDERKRALSLAGEILHTHAGEVTVKTSIDWKTIIILSFSRAANQDRRKRRGDRRERKKDRRSASRR
jgi:signal transduction histidine kinase